MSFENEHLHHVSRIIDFRKKFAAPNSNSPSGCDPETPLLLPWGYEIHCFQQPISFRTMVDPFQESYVARWSLPSQKGGIFCFGAR
jgi:hypothetical protein